MDKSVIVQVGVFNQVIDVVVKADGLEVGSVVQVKRGGEECEVLVESKTRDGWYYGKMTSYRREV